MTVEFRRSSTPPDAEEDELSSNEQLISGEKKDDQEGNVDLSPGGEEGNLVAKAEEAEEGEQDADRGRVDSTCTGGHKKPYRRSDESDIEQHVVGGAGGAAGQRNPIGPRGKPNRAGPEPVEKATDRRGEAEGEWKGASTKAERLPKHDPEDCLLKDNGLGPPRANIAEPTKVAGGRDQKDAASSKDNELDQVNKVDGLRNPNPINRPVLSQRFDPFKVGLPPPFLNIKGRRGGVQEAHALTLLLTPVAKDVMRDVGLGNESQWKELSGRASQLTSI